MFKSRAHSSSSANAGVSVDMDTIRRRARQRLIGASVLVFIGVVLFSILLERQPRPLPADISIEMPSTKPDAKLNATRSKAITKSQEIEEIIVPSALAAGALSAASKTVDATNAKRATKPSTTPSKAPNNPAPLAKVVADKKTTKQVVDQSDADQRFIVQAGAFSEIDKANEVRHKLEKSGLKTYVHMIESAQGKRIRVRVGPFHQRSEAEKAANKAKGAGVVASILTL
jgi:DedD protein